jgi:branched-chain amino acid transport system permease protein
MNADIPATTRVTNPPLSRPDAEEGWVLPVLVAIGIALAFYLRGYQLLLGTNILALSIAVLALNLLSGYGGQISLGHGAFLALGGYATAILMSKLGLPFWLAIPLAGLVTTVLGLLIALPAIRLELLYLALATFSLAVTVPLLIKNKIAASWTGGVNGLHLTKAPALPSLGLDSDQTLYLYALLLAAISFWMVRNLVNSRDGRAIQAIRESPLAAATMLIDVTTYKSACFVISAFFTGMAGGLGAVATHFVSPDSYGFFLSITLLVGGIVGGFRSIYGALFGAAFIVLMPDYAERISQGAPSAIFGGATILLMFVMPDGVAGMARACLRAIRTKWSR